LLANAHPLTEVDGRRCQRQAGTPKLCRSLIRQHSAALGLKGGQSRIVADDR
jgi:hypothetical protein